MKYKYLILGGGMAADKAARGIRKRDISSSIGIITMETYPCYDRPPLSKGLWMGNSLDSIWRKTEVENVTFHMEEKVEGVDTKKHLVWTNKEQYEYEKLLIATGSLPKKLPCPDEGVIYLRDLNDYKAIRNLYVQGERFVVIGAGYIGTEMASALAMNGKKVTMIFPGPSIYHRKVSQGFSNFLNAYFTEKGVLLKPNQTIESVRKEGELFHVKTSNQEELIADGAIAGIGCAPALDFVKELKMENGLEVNEKLQTSDPDIYAAGDVASFYYPSLDKRLRIEHEDAANTMGFCAGENMAGAEKPYTHLPYFYSDLFELGYEAVGLLGHDFEIVEDWEDLYRQGTIYYCQDGCVRGAMMWGKWGRLDEIREMITKRTQFTH